MPRGTPPELVINWSPDGKTIAVFDGRQIRLVEIATALSVPSQPPVPGDRPAPGHTPMLAPVFLNAQTVVVLANCCIGAQRLVSVDLGSGIRTSFVRLSPPVVSVRRLKPGLLLIVTALNELVVASRGHTRIIARRITVAAG